MSFFKGIVGHVDLILKHNKWM